MVLVRGDLEFKLISMKTDNEGRYISLEAEVQGLNFLFLNVYVPNKVQEQCRFIENLNWIIDDVPRDKELKLVVGEDFNVALESDLDCQNFITKRFTWRQKRSFYSEEARLLVD